MSLPRNMLRVVSRAALTSTRSSTVTSSWALRGISLSTSSGAGNASSPWAQGRPPKPSAQAPERRGPPPGKCYMAVHITGLDASLTLAELLQSIAATAPVGMILSARLLPAGSTGAPRRGKRHSNSKPSPPTPPPPPSPPSSSSSLKADIVFGNENAPYELRRRAREGTFLVRGRAPFVAVNSQLVFDLPKAGLRRSRVLRIRGPRGVEGFNEEAMRGVLASDAAAMEAVGALGLDSEPVETRDDDGDGEEEGRRQGQGQGGMRSMEWRFFDDIQARAFKRALRDHYGRRLEIASGPDPCWDYQEMTRYLSRSQDKAGERTSLRRQPGWLAPVIDPSTPVYPAYFLEAIAETEERTSTGEDESRPASTNRG